MRLFLLFICFAFTVGLGSSADADDETPRVQAKTFFSKDPIYRERLSFIEARVEAGFTPIQNANPELANKFHSEVMSLILDIPSEEWLSASNVVLNVPKGEQFVVQDILDLIDTATFFGFDYVAQFAAGLLFHFDEEMAKRFVGELDVPSNWQIALRSLDRAAMDAVAAQILSDRAIAQSDNHYSFFDQMRIKKIAAVEFLLDKEVLIWMGTRRLSDLSMAVSGGDYWEDVALQKVLDETEWQAEAVFISSERAGFFSGTIPGSIVCTLQCKSLQNLTATGIEIFYPMVPASAILEVARALHARIEGGHQAVNVNDLLIELAGLADGKLGGLSILEILKADDAMIGEIMSSVTTGSFKGTASLLYTATFKQGRRVYDIYSTIHDFNDFLHGCIGDCWQGDVNVNLEGLWALRFDEFGFLDGVLEANGFDVGEFKDEKQDTRRYSHEKEKHRSISVERISPDGEAKPDELYGWDERWDDKFIDDSPNREHGGDEANRERNPDSGISVRAGDKEPRRISSYSLVNLIGAGDSIDNYSPETQKKTRNAAKATRDYLQAQDEADYAAVAADFAEGAGDVETKTRADQKQKEADEKAAKAKAATEAALKAQEEERKEQERQKQEAEQKTQVNIQVAYVLPPHLDDVGGHDNLSIWELKRLLRWVRCIKVNCTLINVAPGLQPQRGFPATLKMTAQEVFCMHAICIPDPDGEHGNAISKEQYEAFLLNEWCKRANDPENCKAAVPPNLRELVKTLEEEQIKKFLRKWCGVNPLAVQFKRPAVANGIEIPRIQVQSGGRVVTMPDFARIEESLVSRNPRVASIPMRGGVCP
ncbi:hypothetical protein [Shimia sp. SDUM112013]|uniref:hypothetical protein n=1 Tax=Shimia sp. SDUM112013 TaxID=3136160 RepID=UPI0032EF8BE5